MPAFLLLAALAIWVNPTVQQQCHTSEWYSCFVPSLLNARRALMPKDNSSLTAHCNVWRKGWKCHDNYFSKCVADIHSMAAEIVTGQSRQGFNEVCGSNSKIRADLVKHLSCASEAVTITIRNCMDNLESTVHMMYGENAGDRVNSFCCYFQRGYQCFKRHTQKLCGKGAFEEISPSLKVFHFETIDQACSHHDPEGEMCVDYLNRVVPPPSEAASFIARFVSQYLRALQ